MAQAARLDPNAFAELCFTDAADRPLVQAPVHRDLQAFLTAQPYALVELPRDHGKSVQVCIRLLWELGYRPNLRIKLVCASEALAAERCRFLRQAVETNPRVPLVFPDLAPGRPWGQTHFTIERPANAIGPSVAAIGVGTASTGARADLLVCDDIVDVRALYSAAERERVKTFFHENLMNQLEPDGRFWGLFTPWHPDDLNSALKKNPAYQLFRRAVGDNLEPVWPEKWSRRRLEQRRQQIGSLAFARAYRLVCVPAEDVTIRPAWVRFWRAGELLPSPYGGERQRAGERRAYERVLLAVDPAVSAKPKADPSALVTLGETADHAIHCLEAFARQVCVPALIDLIDGADQRWQPEVIAFESNAAFEGLRELLVRQTRFGPKIKGVSHSKNKASRVAAFSVPVENGRFQLRGQDGGSVDASQQALYDELVTFPYGEHDDLLDAAAMGTAYLLERPEPRIW
jgi:predicted phage terminase large subunit-like protein